MAKGAGSLAHINCLDGIANCISARRAPARAAIPMPPALASFGFVDDQHRPIAHNQRLSHKCVNYFHSWPVHDYALLHRMLRPPSADFQSY